MIKEIDCLRVCDRGSLQERDCVAEETLLSITVNGRPYATVAMSPGLEKEFVMGHLLSKGVIRRRDDLKSLAMEGRTARAVVRDPIRAFGQDEMVASGRDGIPSLEASSRIESRLVVDMGEIQRAMRMVTDSQLHRRTGGVHCLGLFRPGESGYLAEDIGRHNALDKALGQSLSKGLDPSELFAASTSRISSEMVAKCSNAGIPLIAGRGATTSLAIENAEKAGLTIVGFVRGERMNIYSNPGRVSGLPPRGPP